MPPPTAQPTDDELLYFLHIPKTAGMSFTDFIKSQFAPSESNSEINLSDFVKTSPEQIAKYKFIAGHFFYGIDDFLKRKLAYITMLRDPVERTISNYAHIQRMPTYPGYEIIKSQSLLEFVRDPRALQLYANLQTRFIGMDRNLLDLAANIDKNLYLEDEPIQHIDINLTNRYFDPAMLERAQERLKNFAFVGLAEQFDEAIEVLCYTFGWPMPPALKTLNVSLNRPNHETIPQEAIDIIRENTQLDAALYETGKELFSVRYSQMLKDHPEKIRQNNSLNDNNVATMQRQIDVQKSLIDALQAEKAALEARLNAIESSFGWRFVLRFNAARSKLIAKDSGIENIYQKLRGH